jgi:hypothetical protein
MNYLVATLSLYTFSVALSCILSDVTVAFNFVAAFAISALAFVFPAWFYLQAEAKFMNGAKHATWRCISFTFIAFGCFNLLCGIAANVIGIISA